MPAYPCSASACCDLRSMRATGQNNSKPTEDSAARREAAVAGYLDYSPDDVRWAAVRSGSLVSTPQRTSPRVGRSGPGKTPGSVCAVWRTWPPITHEYRGRRANSLPAPAPPCRVLPYYTARLGFSDASRASQCPCGSLTAREKRSEQSRPCAVAGPRHSCSSASPGRLLAWIAPDLPARPALRLVTHAQHDGSVPAYNAYSLSSVLSEMDRGGAAEIQALECVGRWGCAVGSAF